MYSSETRALEGTANLHRPPCCTNLPSSFRGPLHASAGVPPCRGPQEPGRQITPFRRTHRRFLMKAVRPPGRGKSVDVVADSVARAPADQWLDTGATGGGNGHAQRRVWAVRALHTVGQKTPSPSTAEWPPLELSQCDFQPPERTAHWPKQAPHTVSPRQATGGLACFDNGARLSKQGGCQSRNSRGGDNPATPTPAAAAPILKHRGRDPDVPWQSSRDQ